VQAAPASVAAAFCASRVGGDWGSVFGTLPGATDFDTILQRALPH
jgi:putative acyl-CoA dehydrogenase